MRNPKPSSCELISDLVPFCEGVKKEKKKEARKRVLVPRSKVKCELIQVISEFSSGFMLKLPLELF